MGKLPNVSDQLIEAVNRNDTNHAKSLVAEGAPVRCTGSIGETPLMQASFRGNTELVKLFLAKGADVSVKDMDGCTALHHACSEGYDEIVKMLLDAGADPAARNDYDSTPLELAQGCGHVKAAALVNEAISMRHTKRLHGMRKKKTRGPGSP